MLVGVEVETVVGELVGGGGAAVAKGVRLGEGIGEVVGEGVGVGVA